MKTDKQIYTLLAAGPELLTVLTGGLQVQSPYRFESLEVKGLERRTDGVLRPDDPTESMWVIEFQAQKDDKIYYRLVQKMALVGENNLNRSVRGLIIFTSSGIDPRSEPWYALANGSPQAALRVVYLEEILAQLRVDDPEHPLLAVFLPYQTENPQDLKIQGPVAYQNLQQANLAPTVKEGCLAVFTSWFAIRFSQLTFTEVMRMLGQMPPLEETRAYKELVAIGEVRGEIKGEAKLLKRQLQHNFGPLPTWALRRIDAAASEELENWGEAIFGASSLDEVFQDKSQRM
jgi:predicted transposase YdaD